MLLFTLLKIWYGLLCEVKSYVFLYRLVLYCYYIDVLKYDI